MKNYQLNAVALMILIGVVMGCSKEEDLMPIDQPPGNTGNEAVKFNFEFPVSEGPDDAGNGELSAVISVSDSAGIPVWSNKTVILKISENAISSEELTLNNGAYRLEKLIIHNGSGTAVYATPLENSDEGQMVDFSLPAAFELMPGEVNTISQPVIQLPGYAIPSHYGYENVDFGENRIITVRMKAEMNIGQFLYEGLQANVQITANDEQGNSYVMDLTLEPGLNELDLPAMYSTYTIQWSKWNFSEKMVYNRDEINENDLIVLHGDQPAKMLKSEKSYHEIQGSYHPYSRTEYYYDSEDRLVRNDFYQKMPHSSELILQMITNYTYDAAGKLEKMEMANPDQSFNKEAFYVWENGRIKSIQTTGPEGMNIEFRYIDDANTIRLDYSLTNGHYFSYGFEYDNGNKIKEMPYGGSTTNTSNGIFEYDDFINPYYLWGITDEYLRYSSRNNEIAAEYTYGGGFPTFIPDTYDYTYDAEGYPVQLIRTFKTYQTKEFGYREKIMYHYD